MMTFRTANRCPRRSSPDTFYFGAAPVANTLNVAAWPDVIVWLAGCVVITGAVAGGGVAVGPATKTTSRM